MQMIAMILVGFFALVGAAAFLSALIGDGAADENMTLVLEKLTANDAEMRVRNAAKLCGRIRCQRLICRCSDEEAELICENLMQEYRIIVVATTD